MIQEAYVSFEIAKLLKKKGFEGYSILTIYDENAANAYIKELQEKHLPYSSDDPKLKEFYYKQPTLQMAMKWLREIYNIIVEPNSVWNGKKWEYQLFIVTPQNADSPYYEHNPYKSYEECVEAAIKYCLENLIK